MRPQRLALRHLLACRTRTVLAVLLIGASLCALDLFAGHSASVRAAAEYRHVIGERLGHLSVARSGPGELLTPDELARAQRIVQANRGVALAMPQMRISGVATTAARSTVFEGEGVVPAPPGSLDLPGKLALDASSSVALSREQAAQLGVRHGDLLTLTGASSHAPSIALQAQVVEVHGGDHLMMPLAMARALHDTAGVERLVVYLHEPAELERRRDELALALRRAGLAVVVRSWQEQASGWEAERAATDLAFDSIAGMVFAVIAATIAAAMAMTELERRRETATLRALGMKSSAVFLMMVAEAQGMALGGVALSAVASALLAWGVNQATLARSALAGTALTVELDIERMAMAVAAVLAVALLAALVPALKAARAPIAASL